MQSKRRADVPTSSSFFFAVEGKKMLAGAWKRCPAFGGPTFAGTVRSQTSPLGVIAASIKSGPLEVLKKSLAAEASLIVLTRHLKGLRGRCKGTS